MEKFILFETFVWAKLVKCTINSAFCNVLARHFKLLIRKMLISFVQKNPVNSVYTFGKVLLVVTMFQIDSPNTRETLTIQSKVHHEPINEIIIIIKEFPLRAIDGLTGERIEKQKIQKEKRLALFSACICSSSSSVPPTTKLMFRNGCERKSLCQDYLVFRPSRQ